MPNWCSNRMYFSGEPAQIAEIKRLASGAVTPLYRRATNEGIQLFLAGSAGLLQITENIRSEQCPGVTAAGRGAVSPENIAFTRWLTHLHNGVLLDEQNCLMLHELWLQSGTGQRRWEELPDDVRETITVHFTAKRGDWCDIWGIRPRSRQWWQLFRMVSQWHVDVVIVERRSFSIVAAVELDDASHLRPERRRRDILLEEVLRQAGIPLLRSHDARKLLQMTGEWLNTTGADQQSPEHRS